MNILIIGEYSGFAKYLSRGFRQLGHGACVLSWGDGFKKIEQEDESISINVSNYIFLGRTIRGSHHIREFFSFFFLKKKIDSMRETFDCALILNPVFVKCNGGYKPYPTIEEVHSLLKNPTNIYLSACGNDYIFNSFLPYRKKTGEYNLKRFTANMKNVSCSFENIVKHVKGVIPVMADYAYAYRYFQKKYGYKIFSTIPLPFDTNSVQFVFREETKISILHGITRPKEKGSPYIVEALNRIKKDFSDMVNIHIVNHLPLVEYLNIVNEATIIIDQCFAWSYGMNTIEAMSMGKVVLSGNEPENTKEFMVDSCPVVNIQPDVNDIYEKVKMLILNPDEIRRISKLSREYAESMHDSKIVAEKYLELFLRNNANINY